jgi:hypothetical protein
MGRDVEGSVWGRRLVEDTIRVFVGRDVEPTTTHGQGSQCCGLDWNQEPPKYKPET